MIALTYRERATIKETHAAAEEMRTAGSRLVVMYASTDVPLVVVEELRKLGNTIHWHPMISKSSDIYVCNLDAVGIMPHE